MIIVERTVMLASSPTGDGAARRSLMNSKRLSSILAIEGDGTRGALDSRRRIVVMVER